MPERFLIYNASAGAGKTFQLVRNFLKICLSSEDPLRFMRILAITFTNKAAREMKHRLLSQLEVIKAYPQDNIDDRKYSQSLAQELGIAPETLKYRAEAALSGILHHYAAFSVSTIDSFTNRLIRSFSRDLDLNGSFQIELDNDRILEEGVDRLLEELNSEDPFTELLSRYIRRELDSEKAGNSRFLLLNKGKELFQERAFPYLERLAELEIGEVLDLEKSLRAKQDYHQNKIREAAKGFLKDIKDQGLEQADFKKWGLAYWAENLAKDVYKDFNATQKRTFEESGAEDIASAKGKKTGALSNAETRELFFNKALALKELFNTHYEPYFISDLVLSGLYPLALLGAIESHVEVIKQESGRLPIGDFNKIISRELREQPAPFLYERIGDRYDDFFIDEFQDTSRLQWENLLPLVNNAMASEGSSTMLVGDAKQSIYRFRGGDLQLFVDLFTDKDPSNKTAAGTLYQREVVQMGQNWRSKAELVRFNNRFFEGLSAKLPNPEYRHIYAQGTQEPARAEGGQISLEVLEDASLEFSMPALLNQLNELFDRGYRQRDICILARQNSNCTAAAAYLLEHELALHLPEGEALQILSADSLVVGASREVRALVSFLQSTEKPFNREVRKEWISLAYDQFALPSEDAHAFRDELVQANLDEIWARIQEWKADWNRENWQSQDLLEKCYQWMRYFNLDWQQDPYLQFFLDQVADYLGKNRPVNQEFLDWWLDKGQSRSVGIPESTNALQIMSVHKSKGLEFPVVICLAAAASIDKPGGGGKPASAWLNLDPEDYGLDFGFIDLKTPSIPDCLPLYSQWYAEEVSRVMMDNLNIYYVAFTRAIEELVIFSQMPPKTSKNLKLEAELLQFFEASEPGRYSIGNPVEPKPSGKTQSTISLQSFQAEAWQEKLEMVSSVPRHWQHDKLQEARKGSLMHAILAKIRYPQDLEKVLHQAQSEAWLNADEAQSLAKDLKDLLARDSMQALFNAAAEVYNERGLLIPGGQQKIPDRLVFLEGRWYLADYKTGQELAEHEKQIREYAGLLEEAGFSVQQACLIYLGGGLKVKELAL